MGTRWIIPMLLKTYTDVSLRTDSPFNRHNLGIDKFICAHFHLDNDVSSLFPYINGLEPSATYLEKPPYIRFMLDGFLCGLHPDHGVAAIFADRDQALEFLEKLLDFLNDLDLRRHSLQPNYKTWKPVPVLDIFRILPQTNCRACGYATCLAFAAALSQEKTGADGCPGLARPMAQQAVYPVVDKQGNLRSTVTINVNTGETGEGEREDPPDGLLSPRELEVLRLMSRGATNQEIAGALQISPHTVKSHVIHIFNKLGVDDRTQAAV
ncbi:MAG: LuxR C-terminal-related transcriptional regulator, partial [Dehalococcoidales bacterium]|nr:LuxR C-terminal-related transcriptional regulator [Dehalococcoidales bacterium]